MLTIGIFPNIDKPDADMVLKRILHYFADQPVNIVMSQEIADAFDCGQFGICDIESSPLDIALTIGGDGTLLNTCRRIAAGNVPVCGINIGTLGFLVDIELLELESKLAKILAGDYRIEERMMLEATIVRGAASYCAGIAINDVVVTKGGVARMLNLKLSIDEYLVADYQADGLIISTATGSTGYSLSAGGPIINPQIKILLVTPICPHTLNARPMIISQNEAVSVEITASHKDILLTFDGQESHDLLPGDMVKVQKSAIAAKIIKFEDKNYYMMMKNKLWRG